MSEETVSPEAGPLLALRGLTVTYRTEEGPLPAVRGVDLTLAPGEVVGLADESDCDKSTHLPATMYSSKRLCRPNLIR